jgi:hypothetical protein
MAEIAAADFGGHHFFVDRGQKAWLLPAAPWESGVDDGTRTHDNRDHNPGLYQLSYVHRPSLIVRLACPAGLEPATLGLEGRCSIRLSYGHDPKERP